MASPDNLAALNVPAIINTLLKGLKRINHPRPDNPSPAPTQVRSLMQIEMVSWSVKRGNTKKSIT